MSAVPKPAPKPSPFHLGPRDGSTLKTHSLIRAVYDDDVREAEAILKADPDQINSAEPFAGLSPIHIAIFRQNEANVALLAGHPRCDVWQRDNFQRTAVDMLIYTANLTIFDIVMRQAYPDQERTWGDPRWETGNIVSIHQPKKDD